jgi:hypothetical protein
VDELLVRRAIEGLDDRDRAALETLLVKCSPSVDVEAFDRAAAAIHIAALKRVTPLPATLRQRIERDALRHFASRYDGGS